ncbi:hypothetical protein MLG36_10495 [Escherichia coli]|nr:hypothetical protein [Escherichia coli]
MLSLQQGHDFLARPGSTDPGGNYYRSDCQLVA